jgi:hypothetical protein
MEENPTIDDKEDEFVVGINVNENGISSEHLICACEVLRKFHLHLHNDVMPLKDRINNAKYYGRLKSKLLTLKRSSEQANNGGN